MTESFGVLTAERGSASYWTVAVVVVAVVWVFQHDS